MERRDSERQRRQSILQGSIELQIRHYVVLKTFTSLMAATAVCVVLLLLDVPAPYLIALLTFVANYIPVRPVRSARPRRSVARSSAALAGRLPAPTRLRGGWARGRAA